MKPYDHSVYERASEDGGTARHGTGRGGAVRDASERATVRQASKQAYDIWTESVTSSITTTTTTAATTTTTTTTRSKAATIATTLRADNNNNNNTNNRTGNCRARASTRPPPPRSASPRLDSTRQTGEIIYLHAIARVSSPLQTRVLMCRRVRHNNRRIAKSPNRTKNTNSGTFARSLARSLVRAQLIC